MPSDASSMFAALTRGARFHSNERRNGNTAIKQAQSDASAAAKSALDFFGAVEAPVETEKGTDQPKKRRRRRGKRGDDEDEAAAAAAAAAADTNVDADVDDDDVEEMRMFRDDGKRKRKGTEPADEGEGETAEDKRQTAKEAIALLRREMRITVAGHDVPKPCPSFQELPVDVSTRRWLLKNIEHIGWTEPTPIQMQAIPVLIAKRDLIACAPTGSGKTAAFVIPIFARLQHPAKSAARALIISPTRELAQQISEQCHKIGAHRKFKTKLIHGPIDAQAGRAHCDVLVSTPLRLIELGQQSIIDTSKVEILVMDEADRLMDAQFVGQVDQIMTMCTLPAVNRALFSATMPAAVEELAKTALRDSINVTIGAKNSAVETVKQSLLFVGNEDGKLIAIRQLVQQGLTPPVLIFVQSVERAKELFRELIYDGINADVIHSERNQTQRANVVKNFRLGKIWVLITTELMGRGMDFKGVNMVINYDFPQSVYSYIHRIGRTGRAGRAGEAVTYFTKDDAPYLRTIANVMKQSGCDVPDWMLALKSHEDKHQKSMERKAPRRKHISTDLAVNIATKKLSKAARSEAKRDGAIRPWVVADPNNYDNGIDPIVQPEV